MADQASYYPKKFGPGDVVFIVVAADREKAVVFVTSLEELKDVGFLKRVAQEVYLPIPA
ncbi:MAG: hypothetical protein QXP98_00030 [Thermoproteus sp.]